MSGRSVSTCATATYGKRCRAGTNASTTCQSNRNEVGASGEEFPAPPDLLYLIWVVLEAADKWASDKRMVFYIDTEGQDYANGREHFR